MSRLLAACLASCVLAACSTSPAGPCDNDSQCTAPATCDTGRHLCVLPCEPKCSVGEVCLSAKCVQQGPVVKSVTAPTAWSPRAGSVTVTAVIDDGAGPGITSAALHIAGQADVAGTTGDTGASRTYSFSVPATVQAAGAEAPIAFTIDAVDAGGATTLADAVGTGQLLIDDKGPRAGGVTVNGGVADALGIKWFPPSASAMIDAQATIDDAGSGVNAASLTLMSGGTRIDTGTPACTAAAASLSCHFSIPQSQVAAGSQRQIQFSIAGADATGNAIAANTAAVGIDGKAPQITFTPAYPAAFADCNGTIGDDGTIFCGHDGSHFFRAGDGKYKLSFTANDVFSPPDDVGSGIDPASGSCAIQGSASACVVTFNSGTATFEFPADFATATFASGADGTGTVQVSVNARDRVGNTLAAAVQVPVNVTRLKWMRSMAGQVDTFKGSPVVTTVPARQLILAGAERDAFGPIASVGPDGSVLWRAGHGDVTTVSNNVAYSSVTQRLYVLGDNAAQLFAYDPTSVTAGTPPVAAKVYACPIDDGILSTGQATGAPAILAGTPERVLVADSGEHRLWAFSKGSAAGTCSGSNPNTNNGGAWTGSVNQPTTDGSNIFVAHDGNSLSALTFSSGAFGSTVHDASSFAIGVFGPVALAGSLFFGDTNAVSHLYGYTFSGTAFTPAWTSATALSDPLNASVVVGPTYAFGVPLGTNDGHLHAYDKAAGTAAFTWPTTTTKIGTVSAPALGGDGLIYFTDSGHKELVALNTTPALPATWSAGFTGSALQLTASSNTLIDSVGTEPVIDNTGMLYFGTAAGKVYAIITDSGGPLTPTAGSTWPRVGYDNCNSSNTAFNCQ